jgi:hypothetical protein
MRNFRLFLLTVIALGTWLTDASGQNPFVTDQFTADPTARAFNGRIYVYPSHDIPARPGRGRAGWFVMEDYHVFSSANLTDWTDHGLVVSQYNVPWVDSTGFSMWAPDCIERGGKYYFYFPAGVKAAFGRGSMVGVAISDKPSGPFVPQPEPIKGVRGIDPNVIIDKDGQAYIYWAGGNIYGAKLKDNMLELASDPVILGEFPAKGLKEGPFLFERNGIYYMTYPHVENKIERLEYGISNSPLGPFKFTGVIMDESPTGCWTNHQSVVQFNNQWYLFYHHNDLSPKFDKNRSIRVDSLFFNADGTIKKVIPTLRGVGITAASKNIQIDRYSAIAAQGASIAFIDTANTFKGWKTVLTQKGAWISYNTVDFGQGKITKMQARVLSSAGGTFQVHLGKADGPVIATAKVQPSTEWKNLDYKVSKPKGGIQNLVVVLNGTSPVEIDWISFK